MNTLAMRPLKNHDNPKPSAKFGHDFWRVLHQVATTDRVAAADARMAIAVGSAFVIVAALTPAGSLAWMSPGHLDALVSFGAVLCALLSVINAIRLR